MRKSSVVLSGLLLALTVILVMPTSMRADTFDYGFLGGLFSGSGTITATPDGGGDFTVTGMTGNVVSIAGPTTVTGVADQDTFLGNDNTLFYPPEGFLGNLYFDSNGLSFTLANGDDINLHDGKILEYASGGDPDGQFDLSELVLEDVSPASPSGVTPEPGSLALLGTGLLGIGGVIRRKFLRA